MDEVDIMNLVAPALLERAPVTNDRYILANEVGCDATIPHFAPPGHCQWCGKPLTGRARKFCAPIEETPYPYAGYSRKIRKCTFAHSHFWYTIARFKRAVFIRDDFTCQICGDRPLIDRGMFQMPDIHALHCDHIVPLARGGKTVLENLQTLCAKCNLKKGTRRAVKVSMARLL